MVHPFGAGVARSKRGGSDVTIDLTERTALSEELLRGGFLHAFRDTVVLPDGGKATREYLKHPGAVMIIPLLDDDPRQGLRLVLERQFRYPVQRVMVEFPAGKLDPGEDPLACAQRELAEETGFTAREWAHAGLMHPCISYSTEFIDIWFARGLEQGAARPDPGEFLEVFTASPEALMGWCRDGTVTDGKTLTGALWLHNVLSGAWALTWQDPKTATASP